MSQTIRDKACRSDAGRCAPLPEPVRMNYFHGQLISEADLKAEQKYFRDKLRHYHRCLHGYGVICGLEVAPIPQGEDCAEEPDPECKRLNKQLREVERALEQLAKDAEDGQIAEEEAASRREELEKEREKLRRTIEEKCSEEGGQNAQEYCEDKPGPMVEVACGAAVDCEGNDLILRHSRTIDLLGSLSEAERNRLADARGGTVYLSICYVECGSQPTRPLALDSCATTTSCQSARIAEGVRFHVTTKAPPTDERCEPCCSACEDACLLLAAIDLEMGHALEDDDIDHTVRRRFGLYDPTVITGISWKHGATYSATAANDLLGTKDTAGGLEIRFSRPIHVDSVLPGVIDLFRVTGGRGLAGVIASMECEFVDLPDSGFVDRIRFRDTTGETVQPKDRIMVVVRAPFLLDACCRPVEGLHLGGMVPQIEPQADDAAEAAEAARREERKKEGSDGESEVEEVVVTGRSCTRPPWGPGPWTSGQNGNFESWFYVSEE